MDLIISLMEYAQGRYSLVLLMVFLLTFAKSCAVISLLIPGTSGLLLFGALASASPGHFLLMWMSASLGAIGGNPRWQSMNTVSAQHGAHFMGIQRRCAFIHCALQQAVRFGSVSG